MSSKKIFGYIFLALAGLLSAALIGLLPIIIKVVFSLIKIFSGKLDGDLLLYTIGNIIYWVVHVFVTLTLWKYGIKWTKKQAEI